MGIKPNGDVDLPPPSTTTDDLFGEAIAEAQHDGAVLSEELARIYSQAESAGAGTNELAADLTALELRVDRLESIVKWTTASGTGWAVSKRAGVVQLTINGATNTFTLPEGYRPATLHRATGWGDGGVFGRIMISPNGAVTFYDGLATDTIRTFAGTTFIT